MDLLDLLMGTEVRGVITIAVISLIVMNVIWFAATRRQTRDVETHVLAMGVALASLVLLFVGEAVIGSSDADAANKDEPPIDKINAIEAGLAAPSQEQKKMPDKKKRAPEPPPEPKEGVVKEQPKDPKKKEEKKPPPEVKKTPPLKKEPDPPSKIKPRPDPDANPDTAVGPVTTPNLGPPNNNTAGNRAVNTGDPFWARLSGDIYANFAYPAVLETKKIAMGCFHFAVDGTVSHWRLIPRSEDATLDDAVERALTAVQKQRKANPEQIPSHLLKQATEQWNCFPLGNLARQG
jgi:hypothetical protein